MLENFNYTNLNNWKYINALLTPEPIPGAPIRLRIPARIGIQSRGEMASGALSYFTGLGYNMDIFRNDSRVLVADLRPSLKIFKLRTPSILAAMRSKELDMAIIGADIIAENNLSNNPVPLVAVKNLGFGDCKFCLGFSLNSVNSFPLNWNEARDALKDTTIATSLPNIFRSIMKEEKISINENKLIAMDGSLETAIELWGATAVADRVSTGETMFANGIRPEFTLAYYPGAFLVVRKDFLFKLKYIQ